MCYPLCYYIPTFSDDGRFLVYHKSEAGQVQPHCLDLAAGESRQLTYATAPAAAKCRPMAPSPWRNALTGPAKSWAMLPTHAWMTMVMAKGRMTKKPLRNVDTIPRLHYHFAMRIIQGAPFLFRCGRCYGRIPESRRQA